jgi:hypothetical protein
MLATARYRVAADCVFSDRKLLAIRATRVRFYCPIEFQSAFFRASSKLDRNAKVHYDYNGGPVQFSSNGRIRREQSMRIVRCASQTLVFLAALTLVFLVEGLHASNVLELQLASSAKKAMAVFREEKIASVGVLKFSMRIGEGGFPSSLGLLNHRLAEKFQLALVQANPAQESKASEQVGVIRDASSVAATIPGASHVTPEGRALLFSKTYPLAWVTRDQTSVVPDAFVIGVGQIHADLKMLDIELSYIRKGTSGLEPLDSFSVPTDIEDLMEGGESFTTRGLFDGGEVNGEQPAIEFIAKKSLSIRNETLNESKPKTSALHPLAPSSDSPLSFEVWYNEQVQPLEFRNGAAFLREPTSAQKVIFVVRRRANNNQRYGVLVRVNGENTLYRERIPDARASVWIMEPAMKEFSIRGFQRDQGTREDFRVLSKTESNKRSIDYGRDVGMISFVVFQEAAQLTPPLSDDELDLAIQAQAKLPSETAPSLGKLNKSLTDQLLAQDATRGLIVEGEKTQANIRIVTFQRDPLPAMSTSIRYFNPNSR